VPIEISEEMMPGVVSIPHGWGHDRLGLQLEVAQQHAGASINDLTDHLTIDALCGTAALNGTWVAVQAVDVVPTNAKPTADSSPDEHAGGV
jgi:anaerobic selenocysteine-containing dehydrogenase